MFTVCPKCALTLAVTAADLRIAQGYVRCGRCLNVFNALARLSEERPAAAPPPPGRAAAAPQDITEPPQPSSTLEDTGEIEIELDASVLVTSTQTHAALEETAEHEAPAAQAGLAASDPHQEGAESGESRPEPAAALHTAAAEEGHAGPADREPVSPEPGGAESSSQSREAPARTEPEGIDMARSAELPAQTALESTDLLERAEASPDIASDSTDIRESAEASARTAPDNTDAPENAETAAQAAAVTTDVPENVETAAQAAADRTDAPESAGTSAHLSPDSPAAQESAKAKESAGAAPSADAPEAQQTNSTAAPPDSAFELTRRPRAGLAWQLGAGALVMALALQVVNHYRDTLAANPALSGPLTKAYAALGVKLAPPWNIGAYDVRQLGASVGGTAAGEIVVRASVMNGASRAQPLPLLRVTLQDRFGNRIAARDVPPGDYLPSAAAAGALLAAGSRVDATMVFVDPGPQAVGFEIDACLRQRNGAVECAHGP